MSRSQTEELYEESLLCGSVAAHPDELLRSHLASHREFHHYRPRKLCFEGSARKLIVAHLYFLWPKPQFAHGIWLQCSLPDWAANFNISDASEHVAQIFVISNRMIMLGSQGKSRLKMPNIYIEVYDLCRCIKVYLVHHFHHFPRLKFLRVLDF